jgi:hypothetical protein
MKIPSNTQVDVEIVTFNPTSEDSETDAKQRIAALIKGGFEIAAAAGFGDGTRVNSSFHGFVTVILQRVKEDVPSA